MDELEASVRRAIGRYYGNPASRPFLCELLLGYVTEETVDRLVDLLPADLKVEFIQRAEALVNYDGTPIGWGKPAPEELRRAINGWIRRHSPNVH